MLFAKIIAERSLQKSSIAEVQYHSRIWKDYRIRMKLIVAWMKREKDLKKLIQQRTQTDKGYDFGNHYKTVEHLVSKQS